VKRGLRRRYGRAKGHLPLSRLSLTEYERELTHALHYLGLRASLLNEEERMTRLRGWENGKKPIMTALAIEKLRRTHERKRAGQ
jgi:hypothetical protein